MKAIDTELNVQLGKLQFRKKEEEKKENERRFLL